MAKARLRPRTSRSEVNLADLTKTVTDSVRQVLEERPVSSRTPPLFKNPRIIIGLIIEPPVRPEVFE